MNYLIAAIGCVLMIGLIPFAIRWKTIMMLDKDFDELEKVVFAKAALFDCDKANSHRKIIRMASDSNALATQVIRYHAPSGLTSFLQYMSLVEGVLRSDCLSYRKDNDVVFSLYWMRVREGIEDYIVQNNLPDFCRDEISKLQRCVSDARRC